MNVSLLASALLGLAILLSGFAALCYQVVWQRALTQSIGSDAIAVVLVVTIFMAWLGAGAAIVRGLLRRSRRRIAFTYAAVELGISLCGVVSVPLLRAANGAFALTGVDSVWADFTLNLLLLALPIIGMGMTTPLIVHAARQALENFGRTIGLLYGLNILGASAGALVCGLVLIEWLGLQGVTQLAAVLNLLAAGAALLALRSFPPEVAETAPTGRVPFGRIDVVAVLFGFGTLAMQVLFFRVLHAYLTLSTLVFPLVLCAYLLLMSAGQWIGGQLADRYPRSLQMVAAALFASGALLMVAALNMSPRWAILFGALRFTSFNGSLLSSEYQGLIGDPPAIRAFVFALLFMVSVAAWSALFPVLLKAATRHIDQAGASFGRLYGMYTVGNVVGTLITGNVLLAWVGTSGATAIAIVVVGAGAWLLADGRFEVSAAPRLVRGLVMSGLATLALVPLNYYEKFQLGAYRVSDVIEGRVGVATVTPTSRFYSIVDMSRTASASAMVRDPGPSDSYEAWRWNHTELMALDPGFRPRRILVIGIGHAYLPHALLDLPSVEEIVVVDLSPEVVDAVVKYTATSAARVFTDPRVKIVIADGRRYVQSALKRGERFDLVQIKINDPWHAGSGNLFTVEFFGLVKGLLSDGGYLGVLQLLGHLSDGLQVFGAGIYPGYYHLLFKNGELPRAREAVVAPEFAATWKRALPGLDTASPARPRTLEVAVFTAGDSRLQVDVNSDDRPTFEYYWLRQRLGTWISPQESLDGQRFNAYRRTVPVVLSSEP
jgi:spermidine synthase